MDSTPFWKKINQTVRGHTRAITDDIVEEILKLSKNELVEGLRVYKPYTKQSFDDWVKSSTVSTEMNEFIQDLSQYLNLEANTAYLVMCNYLMFEYYGKIKEFWQITRKGTTSRLKESIWNFYTSERMFLLKTLRQIFEYLDEESHNYTAQYNKFVKSINVDKLLDSLIEQFEMLISETPLNNTDMDNPRFEKLLCRNNREQIDLLLILVLVANNSNLSTGQFQKLVKLFVQHNFTTQPLFFGAIKADPKDKSELLAAEIGCYFVTMQKYWKEDMTAFWREASVDSLNETIMHLSVENAQSLVVLSWLLLRCKTIKVEGDELRLAQILGHKPFVLLETIVSNQIFKDCKAGDVVLGAIFSMLDEFALMHTDPKPLYEEEGVMRVLIELLRVPELSTISLLTRDGIDNLVDLAVQTFPLDFFSFTGICRVLLSQKQHYKDIIQMLNNVPSFLSDMTWTIPKEQIYVLNNHQRAFPDSDLVVFPPNTTVKACRIFGNNYVLYKTSYSYFRLLEYLTTNFVENAVVRHQFDEDLMKKVVAGYNVVIEGIKYCTDMDLRVVGLQPLIEKMDNFITRLDISCLHPDLVKLYFDIHNSLMLHRGISFFESCPEIVWKMFFPKIRGDCLARSNLALLFNRDIFEETLLYKIVKREELNDDHSLILTFIELLHNIIKDKLNYKNFQFSSVAYLLNCVFLQHQSWRYKDENQRIRTTLGCLNVFHAILQLNPDTLDEAELKLFSFCRDAFLHNIYIIETFLRLFVKEKYHLTFLMESESNWNKGPALVKLQCIRMQLALLLILMKLKKQLGIECLLEDKLPNIVKPIASYFTNAYSPIISELSCRFLEKLAQNSGIPLLALLELDHYQVQSLFLEKLRDPLEEENVKIAIIDLINTCVANQNGMTAAFFNLKCFMYWDGTDNDLCSGDTVSDFMVDYLLNIKTSHEFFKCPLQLGILKLFQNLWQHRRENLIENIVKLKDFWPVMMDPFFCGFVQQIEIYTVILSVINLEISGKLENLDEKLAATITKFLRDKKQLTDWIVYLHNITKDYTKGHGEELLSAWMEFLILTKKFIPDCCDAEVKKILVFSCLDGLNFPFTMDSPNSHNNQIIYFYTQLYLMLITSWPIYDGEERTIVYKLTKYFNALNVIYKYLPSIAKETVLCTANRTIKDLNLYFTENTRDLTDFLRPLGTLLEHEYESLATEVWRIEDDEKKMKLVRPWVITLFIGNSLLELKNVEDISVWFSYRNFLQKTMDSIIHLMKSNKTLPFAKVGIDFLISYAESPLVRDFLLADVDKFYFKINAPTLTISVGEAILSGLPVNLKEWWMIFIGLIRLNRVLIHKLGGIVKDICFSFIALQDVPMNEIVCLTKFTVDVTALSLVCEALKFVYTLLPWWQHWQYQYPRSYYPIVDGIKTTINACILSLLGSKKINFYKIIQGRTLNVIKNPNADLLVSVLNRLTEIIYWSTSCLKKTKPDLPDLFDPYAAVEPVTLMIENDFSVPRFELPITPTLTYGKILCLAHYFCKALNQLSSDNAQTSSKTDGQVSVVDFAGPVKVKSMTQIFDLSTGAYEKTIGFMVYMQRSDDMPNEKLSSFLHYDMSGSTNFVISQLNYELMKNALEAMMTFLAGEVFYAIHRLNREALYTYKRELCSEIQFFYEFVRKRTSEQYILVAASSDTMSILQNESDIVKRYMVSKLRANKIDDIVEDNFALVISQWFVNICELSN